MISYGRTPCPVGVVVMLLVTIICFAAITTNAENQVKGNEMASLDTQNDTIIYRQDFCSRYQQMAKEGNFSIQDALSGSELRVHMLVDEFFRYNTSTGIDPEYPGIDALILDKMAEKGNFTWRNSFAITTLDEIDIFQDFLEWGVNKYDVMVGPYTPSAQRMSHGISFVEGILDGSIIMVRLNEMEETPIDWFAYLRPFEPSVWYVTLAVILFSSICHRFIEVLGGKYDSNDASFRQWFMENLYMTFINATGNYEYEPKSLAGRVFGVVFAVWALLLTTAYTANLASFYILKHVVEPPVINLQDAINKGFPICIVKGTHSEWYTTTHYPDVSSNLIGKNINGWHEPLVGGDCELSVLSKYHFEFMQSNPEANPSCSLVQQGQQIYQTMDGFATKLDHESRCPDLVNRVLSYYIIEMKEEGFLDEKLKEHKEFYGTKGHCQEEHDGNPRRLEPSKSSRGRRLKAKSRAAAAGGAATQAAAGGVEDGERAMTLKEMAGTMVLQVVGALVAILLALIGKYEGDVSGRKSRKTARKPQVSPEMIELTQTMRSIQDSFCELRRDMEQRDASLIGSLLNMNTEQRDASLVGSLVNKNTHAVPTGLSVSQRHDRSSNMETMDLDAANEARWAVDSSRTIVFDSGDPADECVNNSSMRLGTFHSLLSSRREQSWRLENGDHDQDNGRYGETKNDVFVTKKW